MSKKRTAEDSAKNAEKPNNGAAKKNEKPKKSDAAESVVTPEKTVPDAPAKDAPAKEAAAKATSAKETSAKAAAAAAAVGEETPPPAAADSASAADKPVEEKLREFEEKYLRAEAENQNIRRRAEKSIFEAHQLALKSFVPALGDVYDCLEKSLETEADAGGKKMREGVALTLRKLKGVMDAHHILPIRPDIGAAFDPALHMALGMLAQTDAAPAGTVAVVVQPGYMISGRVIRAADVMVGQAPPEKTEKAE